MPQNDTSVIENQKVPPPVKPGSLKKALMLLIGGAFFICLPMIYEHYTNPKLRGTPQKIDEVAQVVLHTEKGKIKLWAEVARTPKQQEIGLMFRTFMPADKGMLFVYQTPHNQGTNFWMKNTLIPLDMVFISPNGRVVHVAHNAKPLDESPVGTTAPVQTVLEINGGLASQWGVAVGNRVSTPAIN
jgi:hypothetical protein